MTEQQIIEYAYSLGAQCALEKHASSIRAAKGMRPFLRNAWTKAKPWAVPIGVTAGLGATAGALMPGDKDEITARSGRGALFGGTVGTTLAALRQSHFKESIPWVLPLMVSAPWILGDPHGARHHSVKHRNEKIEPPTPVMSGQ
jgi:hypothetical protein